MDYSLSEYQQMLKTTARDFFTKETPKTLVKAMASDERGYPPELWAKMADTGFLGIIFPEKYGGSGGSFLDLAIFLEEFGRAAVPGPFFATVLLGGMTVLEAGSEAQKQKILPEIAKGNLLLTLAVAERDALYNLDLLTTTAKADSGGYIVNGVKLFVPYAHVASYVVCLARTEAGLTLFLVDTKSPGVSCTLLPTLAGDKQYRISFNQVKVPRESILGGPGQGKQYHEIVMAKAAVARCAEMVGGAQAAMEMSVAYAKERVQFGRPIGSFQAIQHHCADMLLDVETAQFLTWQAAWRLSEGLLCAREVSMAKAWVNGAANRVTALGHQIHGAMGFCWDHDMHLYYKQAKLGEYSCGDTAYHEEAVARELGL